MKKKIGLIMSMVLLFVFVFSGAKNTHIAHEEGNNEFVIGTHNLNNTEKNSAKIGQQLLEPEKSWKRYDAADKNIFYKGNGWKTEYNSHYSNTIGDKICFNFVGSKIKISNTVYSYVEYIDSTKPFSQVLVFEKEMPSFKEYNVEIYIEKADNQYGWFNLDSIDIDENGELKPYKAVKAESITLDKTSMDLIEGSSDKINAKVLPEDATNKKIVWSSSDESIVKVDQEGKVTAIKEGQVTITAKVEGTDLTATCKVNVTKKAEENKNNAILSISLVNGATKEYDVSMQEVEKFINWFEERSNGKGPSLYSFNKKINPYKTVKEYIVHDKIASLEVREYEGTNK